MVLLKFLLELILRTIIYQWNNFIQYNSSLILKFTFGCIMPNRLQTKMVLLYYDVRTKDCQGYLETRVSPLSGRTSTVAKKETRH